VVMKSRYRKILRMAISILLCISILGGMTIQSMYCAPAAVPLIQWGVPLIAKILVTAGCTFMTYRSAKALAERCINDMPSHIEQECMNLGTYLHNGLYKISDNVWNYVKSWADSNLNTGTNNIETVSEEPFMLSSFYPVRLNVSQEGEGSFIYYRTDLRFQGRFRRYSSLNDEFNDVYSYNICDVRLIQRKKYPTDFKLRVYDPADPTEEYFSLAEKSIDNWGDIRYFGIYSGGVIQIHLDGTELYEAEVMKFGVFDANKNLINELTSGNDYFVISENQIGNVISQPIHDVVGAVDAIDNPDYIYRNTATGDRSISLDTGYATDIVADPALIGQQDIIDALENDVVNKTWQDVAAEEVPAADDINTGLIEGLLGRVTGIWSAITGTITSTLDDIRSNTKEEEIQNNNIFDFFISLLLILKQMVLIVLRFLMFITVIRNIPAQSSLFNANTKAVIDYIHNQSLPIFNVSFMQIINAFIGILVAVSVIRIINKNVRANL